MAEANAEGDYICMNIKPNYFLKIPKQLILENQLPPHRISSFIYLLKNETKVGYRCHYTASYMISESGYTTNWSRNKKRINVLQKFVSCMNWFVQNNYIDAFDEHEYTLNHFQTSILNDDLFYPEDGYGALFDFEINEIMKYECDYKPLNKSILLLILSLIRAYTWKRKTSITGYSDRSKSEKPEILWTTFEDISEYTGVSRQLVSRAVQVLEDLGLIKTLRLSSQKIEDKIINGRILIACPYKIIYKDNKFKICVTEEYDCDQELSLGKDYVNYYRRNHKKFYQEDAPSIDNYFDDENELY